MLRSSLTWFSLLIMATALSACCGSTACECDDTYADAVGLKFSLDSLNPDSTGFRARQLKTVYLVRLPLDKEQNLRPDTVQLVRPTAQLTQPIIINNTTPFTQAGNRKLDSYAYKLYLAPARFGRPHSFDFSIDSVKLDTGFRADGCCTCFENKRKEVYYNSKLVPFNQIDKDNKNQLVPQPVTRQP